MSDEDFDFHWLRSRRLNKIRSSVCEKAETEKSYKVYVGGGHQRYSSRISTSFRGFQYVKSAIQKFKTEKYDSREKFKEVFQPAFEKTAVYFKNNPDDGSIEQFLDSLSKIDEYCEEFDFRNDVEDHLESLNEVTFDSNVKINGSIRVKEGSSEVIATCELDDSVFLPAGDYRFILDSNKGKNRKKVSIKDDSSVKFEIAENITQKISGKIPTDSRKEKSTEDDKTEDSKVEKTEEKRSEDEKRQNIFSKIKAFFHHLTVFFGSLISILGSIIAYPLKFVKKVLKIVFSRNFWLLIFLGLIGFGLIQGNEDRQPIDEEKVEREVHELINEERTLRGLEPLDYSQSLEEIADYHSKDMLIQGYMAHDSPNGETMADRYQKFDYKCAIKRGTTIHKGAENVAQTYYKQEIAADTGTVYHENNTQLAQGIVNQWMNSEGHRENILEPYWENEGIGIKVADNPDGEGKIVYATQNFC